MRVAPKAADDGLVPALKVQVVFHARLRKQREGLLMNHGRFAVHVRHVGKHALRRGQAAVLPAGLLINLRDKVLNLFLSLTNLNCTFAFAILPNRECNSSSSLKVFPVCI